MQNKIHENTYNNKHVMQTKICENTYKNKHVIQTKICENTYNNKHVIQTKICGKKPPQHKCFICVNKEGKRENILTLPCHDKLTVGQIIGPMRNINTMKNIHQEVIISQGFPKICFPKYSFPPCQICQLIKLYSNQLSYIRKLIGVFWVIT